MDCLFCKIAAGEIPAKLLYEDEFVLAFYDIDPQAPLHFLVIPREHIACVNEVTESNSAVLGRIFEVIAQLAAKLKLENGYRVVSNCGADAGQSVEHLHFHVLAKRRLSWPPG